MTSESDQDYSDTDEQLEVTWSDASGFKLAFGKYKGRTLEDMIKTGRRRSYLRYLLNWDELRTTTKKHVQCAMLEYKKNKQEHYTALKKKEKSKK